MLKYHNIKTQANCPHLSKLDKQSATIGRYLTNVDYFWQMFMFTNMCQTSGEFLQSVCDLFFANS